MEFRKVKPGEAINSKGTRNKQKEEAGKISLGVVDKAAHVLWHWHSWLVGGDLAQHSWSMPETHTLPLHYGKWHTPKVCAVASATRAGSEEMSHLQRAHKILHTLLHKVGV